MLQAKAINISRAEICIVRVIKIYEVYTYTCIYIFIFMLKIPHNVVYKTYENANSIWWKYGINTKAGNNDLEKITSDVSQRIRLNIFV